MSALNFRRDDASMITLKRGIRSSMVNWQVTATTIYCDVVDDEATILVYKDWSTKCTGYDKYYQPNKETLKLLIRKNKQLKRQLKCEGLKCYRVSQYKEKLFSEEAKTEYSQQPAEK